MRYKYKNLHINYTKDHKAGRKIFENIAVFLSKVYDEIKILLDRRLLKNKFWAIIIILTGVVSAAFNRDATFLIFTLLFGIPLLFAKENWIM